MEDDFLPIAINVNPHINSWFTWGVHHHCKDGLAPMRPEEVQIAFADETSGEVECEVCHTRVTVTATAQTELEGLERLPLLVTVAYEAARGHVPPDHRFGLPSDPSCPLCAALSALTDPLPGEP